MSAWYKNAVIYQLHVKCFFDSNADGVGDFKGLIEKLDYIVSLGVTAIWILPFYPSPLKDDGYDIADYQGINPDYGHFSDFKAFLKAAHARGLKVVTELVINHTSDQHSWFQLSREAKKGSKWDSFYMWSDTADKFKDARIIFKDFESSNWAWDPVKKAYYWHRFYSHQPDLNFDSPYVKLEIFKILDFWFGLGVDGLRLDAIPYLYAREGTNCENLPETHLFLKELRSYVDNRYQDRMLLAEANQWPEDAICYFGDGDECHMAFHFPVMPRMFMALQMEDRFPIIDILDQTPQIPKDCQWAMFLRNHDELTLEMVTDEERDYMYQVYAKDPKARINLGIRRRLAPLLDNNRHKFELMNILLFSLPGTPVIYYGDEIGMGDNYYLGDRNGVRTPMQWSGDRNSGFSKANPQKLYLPLIIDPQYHYENINVENQEQNHSSILWWMKNVITLRQKHSVFGSGSLSFLSPKNSKVLAYIREFEEETVLIVANLSKYCQFVELDLSEYANYLPRDLFSQNKFPLIKEKDYGLSLGPYGYYWLSLEKEQELACAKKEKGLPKIALTDKHSLVEQPQLLKLLCAYLPSCRWFQSKSKEIKKVKLSNYCKLDEWYVALFSVIFSDDSQETYLLPLTLMEKERAHHIMEEKPLAALAEVEGNICIDALYDERFMAYLLQCISKKKHFGDLCFHKGKSFSKILGENSLPTVSKVLKGEQSNTSIIFDEQFYLKFYRRVEEGVNPDLEVSKQLTENQKFEKAPQYAGAISFKETHILAQLQDYAKSEGDAWTQVLEIVKIFFEELRMGKEVPPVFDFFHPTRQSLEAMQKVSGTVIEDIARLIGTCTAEFHLAMAKPKNAPEFTPEAFTSFDQRAAFETMRKQVKQVFSLLNALPEELKGLGSEVLALEGTIIETLKEMTKLQAKLLKVRIHGDYHLGQLMNQGKDYLVLDFEGEPMRTISERRKKRLVLQDIAGMIRSFHYAAHVAILQHKTLREEEVEKLDPWADAWAQYVSYLFYQSYLEQISSSNLPLVPLKKEEEHALLRAYLLDKSIYEIRYELNNRPEWLAVPLKSISSMLRRASRV